MTHKRFHVLWHAASILWILVFVLAPLGGTLRPAHAAPEPESPSAPAATGTHLVINLTLSPDSPNILKTGQQVTVGFDYVTTEASGVRIFVRPFSGGSLTPGYSAHGSPLYPMGKGQGSGYFTIMAGYGDVVVDQIRIQMWNANQTTLLFETYLPVYYLFTDNANAVTNINFVPDTPNVLGLSEHAGLTFTYQNSTRAGVRIWAMPYTNGAYTPHGAFSGSPLYPAGSGSGSAFVTVHSGQAVVDQILIQMWDDGQTTLLFEAYLPVYFRFMALANSVTTLSIAFDTPNVFQYGDNVYVSFKYQVNSRGGARIWIRPFSGSHLSPDYAAHPSPIYSGSGSGSGYFTLNSGPTVVDHIRIQMVDPNTNALLYETFLPVHLYWAGAAPPPGPDMHIDAIEVTQGVQDLNNSVVLVAGKRTYVRVHVSSPVNQHHVYATLKGKRGWSYLTPTLSPGNPGGDITVRSSPDRGQINDSFWFELPSWWTTAGSLTLTAYLDPNNAVFDPDTSDNVKSVTVTFHDTPPLRLRLVNVRYTSGGHTYLASNTHLNALESWLRRAYPISDLQVTRTTYNYPRSGLPNVDTLHSYLGLMKLFNILLNGEDVRTVYYGLVDDGGGFMRGKTAGIPSTISAGPAGSDTWGWDFDGSYADWYGGHEIGHSRGRYHAEFCGAQAGKPYPYTSGRISPVLSGNTAIYGFDIVTHAIYPPTWKDVMTYCNNEWLSDFTYEGIRDYIVSVGMLQQDAQQVTAGEYLLVSGLADLASNTASLNEVYKITKKATLSLPDPGNWSIDLLDSSGKTLASYDFTPKELTDPEGGRRPAVISEIVPWVAGTTQIVLSYQGTPVTSRSVSATPPVVNVTPQDIPAHPQGTITLSWTGSDSDGDSLTYSVHYSTDNGVTWQPLTSGLTEPSFTVDTSTLPGGTLYFKIIATDGVLTGETTTGPYTIPLHAPSAQILSPGDGAVFFPTQMVTLQGSAYDMEDGLLGDTAFQWASSLNGTLGSGAALSTDALMAGQHTITMTVTDSDGMSTTVTSTLTIGDENTTEAANLNIAPIGVGEVLNFAGAGSTYTLTLHSSTGMTLTWNASEDIPWLSLNATSGTTPSDILLTFDPTGLPVGNYNGVITITSTDAANTPIEIPVTLQVNGKVIYLPILVK